MLWGVLRDALLGVVGVGSAGAVGVVRTLRTAQWTRASLWPS
jgi:hypothetical protein